jgi:hypothetical protein
MNTRWSALRRYGLIVLLALAANCDVTREPIEQSDAASVQTANGAKH